MSDFNPGREWEEIDFFDIKKDDEILVLTRVTSDAPDRESTYAPVIRVAVDEEDTIFRRKLDISKHTFKPGTIVVVTWNAGNKWTYRVTKRGNFREVKTDTKIKHENYPFIQNVAVVYEPVGVSFD